MTRFFGAAFFFAQNIPFRFRSASASLAICYATFSR